MKNRLQSQSRHDITDSGTRNATDTDTDTLGLVRLRAKPSGLKGFEGDLNLL